MKKDLYARSGILEYWVMNLQAPTLLVFRDVTAEGYQSETSITSGTISPRFSRHLDRNLKIIPIV